MLQIKNNRGSKSALFMFLLNVAGVFVQDASSLHIIKKKKLFSCFFSDSKNFLLSKPTEHIQQRMCYCAQRRLDRMQKKKTESKDLEQHQGLPTFNFICSRHGPKDL